MTRAQRTGITALIFSVLYLLAFFETISLPLVDSRIVGDILPVLPWWMLVSFGSYTLWSMGWGLFTFRDCPEAYTELMSEISEAKNDLRSRGVTVD